MKKGWKPLDHDGPVRERPDGTITHRDVKKANVDRPFMEHSDGATYQRLERIDLKHGGAIYIDRRYTEITDPKWYHRPLYWVMDKLESL